MVNYSKPTRPTIILQYLNLMWALLRGLGPVNGPTAEVKIMSKRTGLAALKIIIIKQIIVKLQEKEMARRAEICLNKFTRN